MARESAMFQKKITLTLTAEGKSKEDAVDNIFALLRKNMYKEVPGPLIHMEPSEFYIDDIEVKKFTEKFMFFFMPREKEEIKLTATIVVNVRYLEF